MCKYVNTDELLKQLNACKYPAEKITKRRAAYNAAISDVCRNIDAMPAADVEKVQHGKWIPVDSYSAFGGDEATWMAHGNPVAFYYCSECKEQAYAGEDGESLITDYCPNCGAKMK